MGVRTAACNQERECSGTLEDAICTVGRATSCVFHHSSLRTDTTLLFAWREDPRQVERILEDIEMKDCKGSSFRGVGEDRQMKSSNFEAILMHHEVRS